MTEIEQLNSRIGAEYTSIDGRAMFRLVWSEEIFENRHGVFREFTPSGLFIREVTEVKRVRKYGYIHNRWIFEAWAPGNLTANPETPDAINGDYVPVYVFEDKNGQYLPPNEKVVRFIIASMHGKVRRDIIPSQEYLEERQIQRDVDAMDDHPAWFQTAPGPGRNAIWYSGGVPDWQYRRATSGQFLGHERPESQREKAEIFRQELQELENLQAQKRALQTPCQEAKAVPQTEEAPHSPMHKGGS